MPRVPVPPRPPKVKRPRGRPSLFNAGFVVSETDFNVSHPQLLFDLLKEGKLDCEIYAAMGVTKDTFYRWRNEHPDFKRAFELGVAHCEAWWTSKIRECWLRGDDKGFKYCISIMNNKFGWGKDESRNHVTQNTINIQGNMNVLQQKTNDELKALIESDLAYLQLNNIIDVTPESDEPKE